MKTKLYFIVAICLSAFLASCEKTVSFDDEFKIDNEMQFAKITANSEYTKIESQSGNGYIMYKELTDGKTGLKPYFTDEVKVLYTGWFKRYWTKDDTFTGDNGNVFKNKVIFDSTADRNDIPSKFTVGGSLVDGFSTALQHMEVGDKWEVWIPWQLGYGAAGRGDIKGYTTMVFEIELREIVGRNP